MSNRVIGPGVSLPPAQALYPANLTTAGVPYTSAANTVSLAPGQSIQIPAGDWMIDLGKYSILEYQDPTNYANISQTVGVWRQIRSQRGTFPLRSDGVNYRISNLTGCAVAAVVKASGTGYAQATTTVTPSTGNSEWQAIVGGHLLALSCSIVGANYGLAPLVFISPPPSPGVQATAVATVSAGAINGFTITNQGAGYTSAPTVTILPNPFDPTLATTTAITSAVADATLGTSTAVSAILCTNSGAPVATSMTLSIGGAGSGATCDPVFLTTITALTASIIGSGSYTAATLFTTGGVPGSNIYTNPAIQCQDFIPRQPQATLPVTSGAIGAQTIIDGGMFLATPTVGVATSGGIVQTAPTVSATFGGANDTVIIQPL